MEARCASERSADFHLTIWGYIQKTELFGFRLYLVMTSYKETRRTGIRHRDNFILKKKVKSALALIKQHAMKIYRGVEV
jgi:hypothetical protein